MNINKLDLAAIVVGVATIGLSIYSYYRDTRVAKKVEDAVDDIEKASSVDISDAIIKEAVNRMTEKAVGDEIKAMAKEIVKEHEEDLRKQVSAAVYEAKQTVEKDVTEELRKQVSSMNPKELRKEVKLEAKEKALRKLEKDMEEISYNYKQQLRRYGSTASGGGNGVFSMHIG